MVMGGKRYLLVRTGKRCLSSSALRFVPDFVRDAIKNEVINEVTRHPDSQRINGRHHVNGNGNENNTSFTSDINLSSSSSISDHGFEDQYGIQKVLSQQEIDSPLSPIGVDPLVEWHLNRHPSYSHSFPSSVAPLSRSTDPFVLSAPDNALLSEAIRSNLTTANHPVLDQAASHFFSPTSSPGKMIRPAMVFLLSQALTSQIYPSQRRLAEIAEMIHTASLFHDDVIDESDTRRGNPAVHRVFGNKVAILAGDFLLARASRSLARLRSVVVMETMSLIIDHLVQGEVMQIKHLSKADFEEKNNKNNNSNSNSTTAEVECHHDVDLGYQETRMEYYLRKNFYKTGSLMAQSCMSTAILGNFPPQTVDACYRYGKHIGLAFQLVDDVLDFEGSQEILGKPALNDLNSGIATAPVLHIMETTEEYREELEQMMERKFRGPGDVERACYLVEQGNGLQYTKDLAQVHAELAIEAVMELPVAEGCENYRDALVHLANKVVDRVR